MKPRKFFKSEKNYDVFFEKVVLHKFKEFPALHDDLKIIWKKLTRRGYLGQKKNVVLKTASLWISPTLASST